MSRVRKNKDHAEEAMKIDMPPVAVATAVHVQIQPETKRATATTPVRNQTTEAAIVMESMRNPHAMAVVKLRMAREAEIDAARVMKPVTVLGACFRTRVVKS
mmetsp:Transcript_31999/g.38728  ORF Transcript_31999/g.38728 Transcript_31999/m.38728 type:complete len:102 (-) Transcript_31999:381-686(-)|eukprot:CAMPEP_0197860562 /NCGR_PEP_ID=MMETSP1438-20131217/36005_1 /TAXON_ID=1461541 /ORGANISM="Pterosperma sp., Strain CCMP1384" /LENGTH=101 /DNA_ID=CAMNT_0043477471 /DNA_START=801 /DNA_END=1106 /DNA_ORIENTATION=-